MADARPSYLDRLYDEISQLGSRVKTNLTEPSKIFENFVTPYQSPEEQARLNAQQVKEDYMAMQDEQQPAAQTQAAPSIPGLTAEDSYNYYLQKNAKELQSGEFEAPTFEEYKQYWLENQSPEKATRVEQPARVKQAPAQQEFIQASRVVEEPPTQRKTLKDQINSFKFEGDRYEAKRLAVQGLKTKKINEANNYVLNVFGPGSVEGQRELDRILKQIDANYIVPKPIEETEAFKSAQQALVSGKHPDKLVMLGEMKSLLESAKQIKDKAQKVSFLEVNLPKLAQSIAAGADAIQPAEAARIMPELNTILQEPSQLFGIVGRKGIFDAFSKQPDAFIEKLSKLYNASFPVLNERSAFYNNQLGSAFQKLGAGYLTPIGEKNQGLDITKLQQLKEGRQVQSPIFSQTNPADRPAQTGPQIVPGMRFGTAVPSSFTYGSAPVQVQSNKQGNPAF